MSPLTLFEQRVLGVCLAGDHPILAVLRQQADGASVAAREHTGVGAYVEFSIPESAPLVDLGSFVINDVHVEVIGVTAGATTLLYVEKGKLQMLEFATIDSDWPYEPSIAHIGYLKAVQPGQASTAMAPATTRDPDTLSRALRFGGAHRSTGTRG